MTRLTTTRPATVVQTATERARELTLDLTALVEDGALPSRSAIFTRPTVLRRLAAAVAERVPAGTDRLVATTEDALLVAAVGLHTGIAFAVVDRDSLFGDLHPKERVVLIAYRADEALAIARDGLADRRADAGDVIALWSGPADSEDVHVLLPAPTTDSPGG